MTLRLTAFWFVVYLLLTVIVLLPLSANPGTRLPDDGDAILTVWTLWWSATHLASGYPALLDANTFYPHPLGLLYSEPLLGQGLVFWPLFALTDNTVLATNLAMILTLALSAIAAHVLFVELTGSSAGGFLGAVAFTFTAYTFSQLARIQLVSLQWLPLALFCLHRYFVRSRVGYLAGFTLFSALLGLSCFYYLVFYLVGLAVLLPTYLWVYPHHRRARSLASVGLAGLMVGIVLAPVAVPILFLYGRYGFTAEPASYDLAGYFVPGSRTVVYGFFELPHLLVDHFIGYSVAALAVAGTVALWRTKDDAERRIGLAYLVVAIVGFLLSAGPELSLAGVSLGPGPFALLQKLGPYQNLRAPDRFSVLVTLGLGVLVAFGAAWISARSHRTSRLVGCAAIASVFLAEHWSPRRVRGEAIPTGDDVPVVYASLAAAGDGPVAELPPRPYREMRHVTLDGYFSTFHRRPGIFNKPSFYPPAMELLQYELAKFPSRDAVTLMRAIGIEHVVVHPKRWGEGRAFDARARGLPELRFVNSFPDRDDALWNSFELGGERLYALAPLDPSDERTPRRCACREVPRESLKLDTNVSDTDGAVTRAIDGDRETRWTTGVTQQKGDYFEIAFDRPRRPARIELAMAFPYGEFPRHLEVNGFLEGRGFRLTQRPDVWHKVSLVRELVADPSDARLRIDLVPETVDRLRLFINITEDGGRPWSIPEVYVYESTDDG